MARADQRKFHYIYKITRFDGKYYIGMHSTDDLEDGYFGSGKLLWHSINYHGIEAHTKAIIEFLPSRQELRARERELVNEEIMNDPLCMNLKLGGEGGWDHITPEQQAIGRLKGAVVGGRVSGKLYGKLNQVKANQTRIANGNMLSFAGRTHSDVTKQKMKMSAEGKQNGERNSQFGTCWVCNFDGPRKIQLTELSKYLEQGFVRGRKLK